MKCQRKTFSTFGSPRECRPGYPVGVWALLPEMDNLAPHPITAPLPEHTMVGARRFRYFVKILSNFVFRGSVSPPSLMDRGNTFPLMFETLLMQATLPPHKMVQRMRLRFVHCAARSTHHFVVNLMKIIVLSVLTHKCVGTKLFIWRNTCHMLSKWNSQIMSYVVFSVGKGLGLSLVCLGGLLSGRVKLELK